MDRRNSKFLPLFFVSTIPCDLSLRTYHNILSMVGLNKSVLVLAGRCSTRSLHPGLIRLRVFQRNPSTCNSSSDSILSRNVAYFHDLVHLPLVNPSDPRTILVTCLCDHTSVGYSVHAGVVHLLIVSHFCQI